MQLIIIPISFMMAIYTGSFVYVSVIRAIYILLFLSIFLYHIFLYILYFNRTTYKLRKLYLKLLVKIKFLEIFKERWEVYINSMQLIDLENLSTQ